MVLFMISQLIIVQLKKDILKVKHSSSKNVGFVYFNDSPLKMIKNALYFILKALFTFKMKNNLTRKLWLISKFIMSRTKQQIITIRILPNISRSKGSQTMKVGQLIAYNIRNIFLEKNHKQNFPCYI